MQKIENVITETLEEARTIRGQIKKVSGNSYVLIRSDQHGAIELNNKDIGLADLEETVKAMALSKLETKLAEVEANIVKMAKSIGVEETE